MPKALQRPRQSGAELKVRISLRNKVILLEPRFPGA